MGGEAATILQDVVAESDQTPPQSVILQHVFGDHTFHKVCFVLFLTCNHNTAEPVCVQLYDRVVYLSTYLHGIIAEDVSYEDRMNASCSLAE